MERIFIAYLRTRAKASTALAAIAKELTTTADKLDATTDAIAERHNIPVECFHPAFD